MMKSVLLAAGLAILTWAGYAQQTFPIGDPPILPAGFVGASYSQETAISGGTPPYSWSVYAGALPDGLALSSAGVISGVPTAAGTSMFSIGASEMSGVDHFFETFTLTIMAGPPRLVVTPATLPSGSAGGSYQQN